jgi:hypothetical protein
VLELYECLHHHHVKLDPRWQTGKCMVVEVHGKRRARRRSTATHLEDWQVDTVVLLLMLP